jgi:hypothetical protein
VVCDSSGFTNAFCIGPPRNLPSDSRPHTTPGSICTTHPYRDWTVGARLVVCDSSGFTNATPQMLSSSNIGDRPIPIWMRCISCVSGMTSQRPWVHQPTNMKSTPRMPFCIGPPHTNATPQMLSSSNIGDRPIPIWMRCTY